MTANSWADSTQDLHQTYRWKNVSIVGGGFVSGLLYHPNKQDVLYARTDIGGAYRWNSRTQSWIPLVDWNLYGIESFAIDESDPNRLYLAAGTYLGDFAGNGAILRSTNQGRTFERTDMPFRMGGNQDGRSMGERLAVDPNDGRKLLFGSRTAGLWSSSDSGKTWSHVESFQPGSTDSGIGIGCIAYDRTSSRRTVPTSHIFVGVASKGKGLWSTQDGGATWNPVSNQPKGLYPHHMVFGPDGRLYLAYGNGPGPNGVTDGAVWTYRPTTGEWRDITPERCDSTHRFGYGGLSVDPHRPGFLAVTTLDHWNGGDELFLSNDGGSHWTGLKDVSKMDASASPFLRWGQREPKFGWWMGTVQIDPFRAGTVLFGTGATIWGTDHALDGFVHRSINWTATTVGLEETAVLDLMSPPSGPHLFSAVGDIGGFRHDDFSKAPAVGMQSNPIFNDTDSIDFAQTKPNSMVRVGRANAGVSRGAYSIDGGDSWQPFSQEPSRGQGGGSVAISSDAGTICWSPFRTVPYVTHDFGKDWQKSEGAPANMRLAADRCDPKLVFGLGRADGKNGLYSSSDAGLTFSRVADLPNGDLDCIKCVPDYRGDVWIVVGKRVLHWVSGSGNTPKFVDGISDANNIGFGRSRSGKDYPAIYLIGAIGKRQGAFRSDDSGSSWIWITDQEHGFGTMDHITGDPRIFGRVYLGTNGRGVLYGDPR